MDHPTDEVLSFGTEEHPYRQQDAQAAIQVVVDEVGARVGADRDPAVVREQLERGIAAAGLPQQPEKWVRDTAAELAAGREVVVDRRLDAGTEQPARLRAERPGQTVVDPGRHAGPAPG